MSRDDRHILRVPAGTMLFREGDAGDEAFLIVEGTIKVFTELDGQELHLATLGEGEIIGEMALIDPAPRSASARVISDCALIGITAGQFNARMSDIDPVLRMCFNIVLERHRNMIARLRNAKPNDRDKGPRSRLRDFAVEKQTLTLERELRSALAESELVLYFQPIVELASRRLAGFETLTRWQHPKLGLVAPGRFIHVAEQSGLISDITFWALEEACKVHRELALAALSNVANVAMPFLSVNISARDLIGVEFADRVMAILDKYGTEPKFLKLEVTESMLLRNPEAAIEGLEACRDAGLAIAIDDFGTGHSSLAYLSRLPARALKIDRSFVAAMLLEPPARKIVNLILGLARDLGLEVVAEGIETKEVATLLGELACGFGQGYYFGKPASLTDTCALIRQWQAAQPSDHRGTAKGEAA